MATLTDGFPTILNVGGSNLVCEIEVTPPAINGGEGIPIDCMRSGRWGVTVPRRRRKLDPFTVLVSWGSAVYSQNRSVFPTQPLVVVNINQLITITFPDYAVLSFYGFVTKFEPQAMKEGERPTANLTIQPSLINPYTFLATLPTYTQLAGFNEIQTLVNGPPG